MLKYFSCTVEKPINTGGRKLISDMQNTISRFLTDKGICFKEYDFVKLRNAIHLILPSPYSSYLFFGYLGSPFFTPPMVVVYTFFFSLVAIKKKIAREKVFLIVIDLFEWQTTVQRNKKSTIGSFFKNFQCMLERILISHVADEVISAADRNFMRDKYGAEKVWELEFLDHCTNVTSSRPISENTRVLYCGDLGSRKGFGIDLLEEILKNLNSSCEFWLVASGIDENVINRLERFQNFRFLEGPREIGELNDLAKTCHFGLILYSSEMFYYNILPSIKLSFYISNGLSVISSNLQRTKQLNDKYEFGYVVNRKEMLQLFRRLTPEMTKKNAALQEKIAKGQFLYNVLKNLDIS